MASGAAGTVAAAARSAATDALIAERRIDPALVAAELNDRPRKRLGFYTPREALAKLLTDDLKRVATTP